MTKPYDPQPLLSSQTYLRKLNHALREMHEAYQAYAKIRQDASELKIMYEAAQRKEFEAQKDEKIKKALSTLDTKERFELEQLMKAKGLK